MTGSGGMPRIREIQEVVSRHNGVRIADLKAACRRRAFSWPRQIAEYLCREMTPHSFPAIAREFGDRDHTSIIFACRKVARLRAESDELNETLARYRADIMLLVAEREEAEAPYRIEPAPEPENIKTLLNRIKRERAKAREVAEANEALMCAT